MAAERRRDLGPEFTGHRERDDRLPRKCAAGGRCAFTLVEMLVTIAIVAVLVSLVAPMLAKTIGTARSFRCQMTLRSAAFDFALFADSQLGPQRGDDSRLAGDRFHLETFQESLYGVDEFWRWDASTRMVIEEEGLMPLRCSDVDGPLTLVSQTPCSSGGVGPAAAVSYSFNARLDRTDEGARVTVSADGLDRTDVPLLWDVDGTEAQARGVSPVFSAPGLGTSGAYRENRVWFPALRHNGTGNFAFMDGRVEASGRPLSEAGWDWSYAAR
jgi:prepilin-type N-terminal cleavage/methylation domain-containing protein/prepilin-type processing-associated H-X9-DG protein